MTATESRPELGKVYLVGAGPGDPGLLTLKGQRCLSKAQVVVYDYLANPRLLDFAPAAAERILVGKHGGGARVEQSTINELLIDRARRGLTVVRLKGGDPFLFGRGGEEAAELGAVGIKFEIVPGVSAAIAVPAYAGIPLTHRELSSNVIFTTGYEYPSKAEPAVRWPELARTGSTLVLLMTTRQLGGNMQRLIAAGLPPTMPVAIIEWGTRAMQRTVVGTAATIAPLAHQADIRPPAIAVVGEVVRLREQLQWVERLPLFGRRIVLTRPREQARELAETLEELGAEVISLPTIQIVPSSSTAELDGAIARAADFDWLIFTSANGVKIFFDRLRALGADVRAWHRARIAAIGPQTARQLNQIGIRVDLVPDEFRAEGVLEELGKIDLAGKRILLPRASGARDILPRQLAELGALVEEIATYSAEPTDAGMDEIFRQGLERVDLITFTSSSTVHNFVTAARGRVDLGKILSACIGPITAATARGYGIPVLLQPARYTVSALVDEIVKFFNESGARAI